MRALCLVTVLFASSAWAGDVPVRVLDENPKLPKLPIQGTPVAKLRFEDVRGTHLVVITETGVKEGKSAKEWGTSDPGLSKRIFGYHFIEGKTPRLAWQTKDFVLGCPFDLTVKYTPGSLKVTDLDHDSVAETRFSYQVNCTSDVSGSTLKLLMHEGTTKYAVRGSTQFPVDRKKDGTFLFEGGVPKADPAFEKAPASFLKAALSDWKRAAAFEN